MDTNLLWSIKSILEIIYNNRIMLVIPYSMVYILFVLWLENKRYKNFWNPDQTPNFSSTSEARTASLTITGLCLALLVLSYDNIEISPTGFELFSLGFLSSIISYLFLEKEFTLGLPRTGELLHDVSIIFLFAGFTEIIPKSGWIRILGEIGLIFYMFYLIISTWLLLKKGSDNNDRGKSKTKRRYRTKSTT